MSENKSFKEFIDGEVAYFNDLADTRFAIGIPCQADMRTKTFYEPKTIDEEVIDAKLKDILLNPMRDIALKALFDSPEGDLLDVCCGPGWFCLESARAGRNVTGYDISNKALELANYVKTENSASIAGEITYINKSAEDVDFIGGNFSGVMGWSAFHHLKNPGKFLDHIYSALPHGGIVVTMDDLDSDVPSRIMRYLFKLLLPIYEYTYFQKIKFIFNLLIGRAKLNKMMESPMEIYSDKHGDAAAVIRDKLVNKFVPIYDVQFGAFSVFVGHSLKGPKFFRYAMAWFVTKVDSVLCALRICKGSYRIIVSVKR